MKAAVRRLRSASRDSTCGSSGRCSRPSARGRTPECVAKHSCGLGVDRALLRRQGNRVRRSIAPSKAVVWPRGIRRSLPRGPSSQAVLGLAEAGATTISPWPCSLSPDHVGPTEPIRCSLAPRRARVPRFSFLAPRRDEALQSFISTLDRAAVERKLGVGQLLRK